MVEYRAEHPEDVDDIRNVHPLAHLQDSGAALVDRLRAGKALQVSMVAVEGDEVLAHCAFSQVGLEAGGSPEMFGLTCEFPVPEPLFMAIELEDGALAGVSGRVRYSPEFGKP